MVDTSDERFERMGTRMRAILDRDVGRLVEKDKGYGRSWIKRGGVGAFMMLARKWDRIEEFVRQYERLRERSPERAVGIEWDIFAHITFDTRPEGIMDDIRDLRNYLLLVEEEMMERGVLPDISAKSAVHEDNTGEEHPFGFDAEQEEA